MMDLKIMSRARPTDKQRLVQLLQQKGAVVAVTGDGTNDAPALNHAQVGLSMGTGMLHVLGRELSFAGILQLLAAGTAVGVLFSLVAYESGTVWCGAAMHAVWNMVMIGGVLHIGPEPDGYALLNYVLDSASPLVTGGDFGVEASLPSIAVYLGFSALALVRLKRSKAFAHTA